MKSKRNIGFVIVIVFACVLGRYFARDIILRKKLAAIDGVVEAEIEKASFPGAVVCVGRGERIYYLKAFGNEVVEPYKETAGEDTIFDLASMTKPIATATSILILVDRGKLGLDDKVSQHLPEFAVNGKEDVRIRHLLTHTSGLPAYTNANALKKEFGNPCPEKVVEKICSLEAVSKPGEAFKYSCLGYIILAQIVERAGEMRINDFARKNIFEPLGMVDVCYNPAESLKSRIAATELVEDNLLRGTVHDPLAQLMGGVSGNAGVFSTAGDVSIYCRMLLNRGVYKGRRILSEKGVEHLTGVQSHGRAYGFDVSSSYSWIKGQFTSEQAFCHSGYTGTSIVCDPTSNVFLIILTNRAHPHDKGASKPVRTKVADIVFSALGGV